MILVTIQRCGWEMPPWDRWVRLGCRLGLVQVTECVSCNPCPVLTRQGEAHVQMQDAETDWLLREATDFDLATTLYGPKRWREEG